MARRPVTRTSKAYRDPSRTGDPSMPPASAATFTTDPEVQQEGYRRARECRCGRG